MRFHIDIKERKVWGALAAALFVSGGYLLTAWHPGMPFGEFVAAISMIYATFAGANVWASRPNGPREGQPPR